MTEKPQVPDEVFFGPAHGIRDHPDGLTYGEVRKYLENDKEKAKLALIARIDDWLLNQIRPISEIKKIWAPFPLSVLTCICIETLGLLKFGNKDRKRFQKILIEIEPRFKYKFPNNFSCNDPRRGKDKKPETPSELIYLDFRNTLVHGYWCRSVYLEEKIEKWRLDPNNGSIILNPWWLFKRVDSLWKGYFIQLKKSPLGSEIDKNFDKYMKNMLS